MKKPPILRRSLIAGLLLCLLFSPATYAQNGFWIRKGTAYGASKSSIKRTVVKPKKKPVAPKQPVVIKSTPTDKPPGDVAVSITRPAVTAVEKSEPPSQPVNETPAPSTAAAEVDSAAATAPTDNQQYVGVTFSNPVKQKWRVGVVLVTGRDAVKDVFTYIPIPKEWPEQSVSIFDEDIPIEFAVQKIDELDGLDRLILRGRIIPPKKKIVALQTFMVTTSRVNAPPDTTVFSIPDSKDKLAKKFIASGAAISFRNNALRKQAKELIAEEGTDWEKVERIFDWVRENIDQGSGDPKGSIAAFVKKAGHPEDVVGLFVAMCRANSIPARMVFCDGTQYAEFLLADPSGQLHWFPCDVVGIRAFGKIVEPKVILQKGDNIRVPGVKGKKKFVAAYGEVKSMTAPKQMLFVREPLND
jgi:transglutaminase-like putative cysteine protease